MTPPETGAPPPLGPLPRDTHKGDRGRVLVVGGTYGMAGAPSLAALAALRAGAGLVTIACPASIYPIVAGLVPCAMGLPLPESAPGRLAEEAIALVLERARGMDAVCVGPGLGRGPVEQQLAAALVERVDGPWVADADALNALAGVPGALARAARQGVLTPHPGEMARLVDRTAAEVQADREAVARGYAVAGRHVLVLKGPGTLVAEGERLWRCWTGGPALATGGSGDVLAGVVATFLAQGHAPFEAARLAVHIHGRAGDLAAAALGERSVTATDVLAHLAPALKAHG